MLRQTVVFTDRWYWVLLVLATPVLLFPSPERAWVMFVVPLGWLVAWLATGKPLSRTPLNGSLLLLYTMVLVSLYATYGVAVSLPKIGGMVLGIGVFFAVARKGHRPTGWWVCLLVFLGIGLLVAAMGLLGTQWFVKFSPLASITSRLAPRITGLPGAKGGFQPNEVAGSLLWVVPVLFTLSVLLPGKARSLSKHIGGGRTVVSILVTVPLTFFVSGMLILTQSRGSYIGLSLAVLVMTLVALPKGGRLLLLVGLILLTIGGGYFIVHMDLDSIWRGWTSSALASDPGLSLNNLEGRLELWSHALYGIQDFMFTGMGMNTFRGLVHVLYPLFLSSPGTDIAHAHNEFLQAALDLGVPGLIAFLALYIGAFVMLWELWQAAKTQGTNVPERSLSPASYPPLTRALVLGLGGGLLAHMIYGLTDAVALGAKPGVLFWMLLGLICGLHAQIRSDCCSAVAQTDG